MPSLFEQTRTLIQPTPFILHPSTPASLAHHRPPARVMHRLIDPIVLPLDLTFSLTHSLPCLCVGDAPALLDPLRACVGSANAHAYEGGSIGERTERKEASPPFRSVKNKEGKSEARISRKEGLRMPGVREGVQHLFMSRTGAFCACNNNARLKTPVANGHNIYATDWKGCGGGHGFRHGFRGGFVILFPRPRRADTSRMR